MTYIEYLRKVQEQAADCRDKRLFIGLCCLNNRVLADLPWWRKWIQQGIYRHHARLAGELITTCGYHTYMDQDSMIRARFGHNISHNRMTIQQRMQLRVDFIADLIIKEKY